MLTFGQLKTRFIKRAKLDSANSTDVATTLEMLNDKNHEILSLKDWYFMEKERTATFVAAQSEYQLPADYGRMMSLWVVVGGVTYRPIEVNDLGYWNRLTETTVSSDITSHVLILEDSIRLYPTPSSTSGTIHMLYRQLEKDMSADDYTTGTLSATAGSRTLTGSGTTWTSSMVGRWVNIANRWYEIGAFSSTTSLTLAKPSLDTVSASTYTIGEYSPIPQQFHDLILKGALSDFYDYKGDKNPWKEEYEKRLIMFVKQYGSGKKSTTQVMHGGNNGRVVDNNDHPRGLHG